VVNLAAIEIVKSFVYPNYGFFTQITLYIYIHCTVIIIRESGDFTDISFKIKRSVPFIKMTNYIMQREG
jgi:hypothetical protein